MNDDERIYKTYTVAFANAAGESRIQYDLSYETTTERVTTALALGTEHGTSSKESIWPKARVLEKVRELLGEASIPMQPAAAA